MLNIQKKKGYNTDKHLPIGKHSKASMGLMGSYIEIPGEVKNQI